MLQLTGLQDDERLWVNPQQVSVVLQLKQGSGSGCTVLMAGGFEIQVQETAEDVTAQINKRLDAF